jgi:hypothetical protein
LIISLASCEFFNILGITTTTKESTTEANTSTTTQATTTTASNENDDDPIEDQYSYYDFTDAEKALYTDLIGEVIPFIPNNEYYVEEYSIPLKYVTIRDFFSLHTIIHRKNMMRIENYSQNMKVWNIPTI